MSIIAQVMQWRSGSASDPTTVRSGSSAAPGAALVPGRFLLAQLLNSIGDGAFYVTSALFFTRVLGFSPTSVGLGLTLAWGIGSISSIPLGALADRVGHQRSAAALAGLTAVSVALFPIASGIGGFVVIAVLYAVAQSGLGATRQLLVVDLAEPASRVQARARLQQVGNTGIALGALVGGAALLVDRPAAYVAVLLIDATGFMAAAALLRSLRMRPVNRIVSTEIGVAPPRGVLRDRRYILAAALNAVLLLYMPLLSVLLPLWVTERTTAPPAVAAAVFFLNTIGVICLQSKVARSVSNSSQAARAVALAGVGLLISCAVFGAAAVATVPVAASAIVGVGAVLQVVSETLLAAGGWHLSYALAPDRAPGTYQGAWGIGIPLARTIGPLLLTTTVLSSGFVGWMALGAAFAGAGAAMPLVVRRRPGRSSTLTDSTTGDASSPAADR